MDLKISGFSNLYIKQWYDNPIKQKYFGNAEAAFKDHFRKHARDLHLKKYIKSSGLSKDMWKLKDEKITPKIKWNKIPIVSGTLIGRVYKLC